MREPITTENWQSQSRATLWDELTITAPLTARKYYAARQQLCYFQLWGVLANVDRMERWMVIMLFLLKIRARKGVEKSTRWEQTNMIDMNWNKSVKIPKGNWTANHQIYHNWSHKWRQPKIKPHHPQQHHINIRSNRPLSSTFHQHVHITNVNRKREPKIMSIEHHQDTP